MKLSAAGTTVSKTRYTSRLRKDIMMNKYVYMMALPVIAFYLIFHYVPMGGLMIAFQDFNAFKGMFASPWVGLKHFNDFLTSPYAFRVIKNTLLINVYQILFGFPAPILLALLINEIRSHAFKRSIQTVSYMPHFISLVVICGMLVDFTASNGVINDIIALFGGERANLLMQKDLYRPIYILSGIWQEVGWGSIIYLATLSSVDPHLYEAASIDGAGRFKKLLHVTIPSLIPTIVILLIMRLGHIMSEGFEKVILIYNPLTYETADVISSYVYRRGLQEANYSFGAAVGLFNSTINFIILVAANALSRKFAKQSLW
ncbi:putative multiple-sugar transport system permease YteP [Paenibacillus solanacearum]|uniref:Multiple-sugar transport system permease YteP n=1 Tax=Paenibacillus solanacearum TaxID=2048548 RepID=A0A916NM35_9BACL|nr:ABC transporter permease subunit [Paenibacillus solanacearum]CAG7600872.1 putative multiple-sugar transport system permease YteP [Paenibacillus solanacearum]